MLLARYHKWRDMFAAAKAGDPRSQAIVERYARMVAFRRIKARNDQMAKEMLAWRDKLANRPILTGVFWRPTVVNGPLPRMTRQPLHISALIAKRRKKREQRMLEMLANRELREDIVREAKFERELALQAKRDGASFEGVFMDKGELWLQHLLERDREIMVTITRDEERARTPFPPKLVEQIMAARRERIANKTRERQRERAGVVLKRTLRRRKQGPPAHILAKMSEKEKHMDWVSRGVSEVGYVGMVKKRLGFKLRDPEAYKGEWGRPEERERLDREAAEIEAEVERRRGEDDTVGS